MNSFYSNEELKEIGFKLIGKNVLLSRKASVYGPENITIGNDVRIDDFCILSGKITLGNFTHLAAYVGLWGGKSGIIFEDFSTISSRGAIYAISDDFSGESMTNPMVPGNLKQTIDKEVFVGKHVIIGTSCTVLPGVKIEEGVAIGACSLVKTLCESWGIYYGIPCKRMKERSKAILNLERKI